MYCTPGKRFSDILPNHMQSKPHHNHNPSPSLQANHPSSALHPSVCITTMCLHGEHDQEGNHQREETSGFRKSETQNGIREQLSTQSRVPRNTGDQSAKDRADTSSCTDESSSRSTGSDELAGAVDGGSDGHLSDTARLAACDVGELVADEGAAHDETGLLGLEAGEGGGLTCWVEIGLACCCVVL